jgi:hypothetical protein
MSMHYFTAIVVKTISYLVLVSRSTITESYNPLSFIHCRRENLPVLKEDSGKEWRNILVSIQPTQLAGEAVGTTIHLLCCIRQDHLTINAVYETLKVTVSYVSTNIHIYIQISNWIS